MNKSFILFDKNNNLQKKADIIVKFKFDEKDYLVYSLEENEQNCQIFVSKIILNSEGKYFIDNILLDEKNKLNNIVYNIVILLPTEGQKGTDFDILSKNMFDKFSVNLSMDVPDLGMQEYFRCCSVAITSKILVSSAIKFYNDNLNNVSDGGTEKIPTWTAPVEATAPISVGSNTSVEIPSVDLVIPSVSIQESASTPNLNLQTEPSKEVSIVSDNVITNSEIKNNDAVVTPVDSVVNPQIEKLAIVSDPSLGIGVTQPNMGKIKKAGFANTKYIVIGTVCLLLAVTVVIIAYILIKNMQ